MERWCRKPFRFGLPIEVKERKETSFDHVDFSKPPEPDFWSSFPHRDIPTKSSTRVDTAKLEELIAKSAHLMTVHERDMADKTVRILKEGAPSYQLTELKGAIMKNAPSIMKCAPVFTQTLKKWIEDKIVAGPFMEPPMPEFRANSLMAEEQKDKVRPVMNMSYPKGRSFNDNVDKLKVGRTTMSSAKKFGQALRAAGKGAFMSKMDMKDAYKLVPAKTEDYRLQGFYWHHAYFIETQQIFGANTAVNNFDVLAKTVQMLARFKSGIPKGLVQQTLDDTACVGPVDTSLCDDFTREYKHICREVNIELAADCPKREKAFTCSTEGTVLGIRFNSLTLSWKLPGQKVNDILLDIHTFITGGHVGLRQTQRLAGRLNNMGQMCPFLKGFKRPLNRLLADFMDNENILLPVEQDLVEDLRVWAAAACDAENWLPIADGHQMPPVTALTFTSDAAGGVGAQDWAGVASLGHDTASGIWFVCRGQWPPNIKVDKDEKGAAYRSKMTTLELVGLLLPFLTIPEMVRGRHIIMGVDNKSVVHAWSNKNAKGDLSASVLVRALLVVTSFLECRLYPRHILRNSTEESYLADCLTRDTTAELAQDSIRGAMMTGPPRILWDWLENPVVDWQLGFKMVDYLKSL